MVRWHHWLRGCEFEQTLGGSAGQGSLACCSPRGHKEIRLSDRTAMTENIQRRECAWHWLSAVYPGLSPALSFDPYSDNKRSGPLRSPLHRWGNWGTRILSNTDQELTPCPLGGDVRGVGNGAVDGISQWARGASIQDPSLHTPPISALIISLD